MDYSKVMSFGMFWPKVFIGTRKNFVEVSKLILFWAKTIPPTLQSNSL